MVDILLMMMVNDDGYYMVHDGMKHPNRIYSMEIVVIIRIIVIFFWLYDGILYSNISGWWYTYPSETMVYG